MIRMLALIGGALALGAAAPAPRSTAIPVTIASSVGDHQSGRLIVFVERVDPKAKPSDTVDFNPFAPTSATIAAREVTDLSPAHTATVDVETDAFPAAVSTSRRVAIVFRRCSIAITIMPIPAAGQATWCHQ